MQVPIFLFYLLLSSITNRISGFANRFGAGYGVECGVECEEEEGEVAYLLGGRPGFGEKTGVIGKATRSDFPQVASLRHPKRGRSNSPGTHLCGGTLIAPNVVITAAHCLDSDSSRNPDVHLGRVNREGHDFGRFESFSVIDTRIHPDYEFQGGWHNHDLALLVLDRPAKTPPAKLRFDDCAESRTCPRAVAWGWGLTDARNPKSLSEFIQKVDLPTVSRGQCKMALPGLITEAMVCAGGEEGKDACQDDSGGPLEVDGEVIGIVSWGDGCGQEGLFGVYASVASMQDWIRQQLRLIETEHGIRSTPARTTTKKTKPTMTRIKTTKTRTKTTRTRTKTIRTKTRTFVTKTKSTVIRTKTNITRTRIRTGRRTPFKPRRLLVEHREEEP